MGFLKAVAALDPSAEKDLNVKRSKLVERLMKKDLKSPKYIKALADFRKAWDLFYGFKLSKDQEVRYLAVLSEREPDQDAMDQQEKKKA